MPHCTIQIIRGFPDPDQKTDAYLFCHLHDGEKIVPFEAKIICKKEKEYHFEFNVETPKHNEYLALTQFEENKKHLIVQLDRETGWLSAQLQKLAIAHKTDTERRGELYNLLLSQHDAIAKTKDDVTLSGHQEAFLKSLKTKNLLAQYDSVKSACRTEADAADLAKIPSFLDQRFYINPALGWPDLKLVHEEAASAYFASIHLKRETGPSRLIDQHRLIFFRENFKIDLADKSAISDQLLGVIFPTDSKVWYDHISQDARGAMGFTAEKAGEIEGLLMQQFVAQFDELRAQLVPVAGRAPGMR